MKRRYFFKTLIGAATVLGTAPGIFLPQIDKPVWKPSYRTIIAFNRQWTEASHQVGMLTESGLPEVFLRSGTTLQQMAKYKRFCDGSLPVRGNLDASGMFNMVPPFVQLRVKGEFKPKAYYF